MTEVERLLADLQGISTSLNRELQTLNEQIAAVEKAVSDLRLGITVWLPEPIETGTDRGSAWRTELGWTKDGEWGLYVRDVFGGDTMGELRRLSDSAREERIAALAAMPKLLEEMKEEAERVLRDIQQATQTGARIAANKPRA